MRPLSDPADEAKRIIDAAESRKVILRLMGGVSFLLRCPSARQANLQRNYTDLDFMAHAVQAGKLLQLFIEMGYTPEERFNAIYGLKRLIFKDAANQRRVDVFLDSLEMCHRFNFMKRLEIDRYTISLADMLVTKLQIVEINEKDVKDIISLLIDYDIGDIDDERINGDYIAGLCRDDWGIYRTFKLTLATVDDALTRMNIEREKKELVRARIARLLQLIEDVPKSLRWKIRAVIGDKRRWYELPEPENQIIDYSAGRPNSS